MDSTTCSQCSRYRVRLPLIEFLLILVTGLRNTCLREHHNTRLYFTRTMENKYSRISMPSPPGLESRKCNRSQTTALVNDNHNNNSSRVTKCHSSCTKTKSLRSISLHTELPINGYQTRVQGGPSAGKHDLMYL